MRKPIRIAIFLMVILYSEFCILNSVQAQEMSSPNYKLQGGMTGMTTGAVESSGSDTKLADIVGDQSAGIFASKGYIINPSFSSSVESSIFSLTLSHLILKFTDSPSVQDKKISMAVYSSTLEGFQAYLIADTPLKTSAETSISLGKTGKWSDESSYGLVYRVDSKSAPVEFDSTLWYRAPALITKNEVADLILTNLKREKSTKADLTVRLKPPTSLPKGQYRNTIHILLLPKI